MANIIMKNIDALCKMQNKRKTDLEKHLGHSSGYLATKAKDEKLTLEQLQKIHEFFGVELNDLMNFDFTFDAELVCLEREIEITELALTEMRIRRDALLDAKEEANG